MGKVNSRLNVPWIIVSLFSQSELIEPQSDAGPKYDEIQVTTNGKIYIRTNVRAQHPSWAQSSRGRRTDHMRFSIVRQILTRGHARVRSGCFNPLILNSSNLFWIVLPHDTFPCYHKMHTRQFLAIGGS